MRIWSCTGIFFTGWSVSIQGRFAATQHYVSTVSSCQTSGFSASPECDTDMGHCRCFESLARSICRGCRTGSRTTTRATKDPRTKKPRSGGFLACLNGAEEKTRTSDPRITNALLYQLSYFGTLERARSIAARARMGKSPGRAARVSLRRGSGSAPRCSRCGCPRASLATR